MICFWFLHGPLVMIGATFFSRAFVSSFWSTSELFYLLGTDKVALVVESFLAILERGLLMKTTSFMTLFGWAP